jgi:hypothetical protein
MEALTPLNSDSVADPIGPLLALSDTHFRAFDLQAHTPVSLQLGPPRPTPPPRWQRWRWRGVAALLALLAIAALLIGTQIAVESLEQRVRDLVVIAIEEHDRSSSHSVGSCLMLDSPVPPPPPPPWPLSASSDHSFLSVLPPELQPPSVAVPYPGSGYERVGDMEVSEDLDHGAAVRRLGVALRSVWILWDTVASLVHFFIAVPFRYI